MMSDAPATGVMRATRPLDDFNSSWSVHAKVMALEAVADHGAVTSNDCAARSMARRAASANVGSTDSSGPDTAFPTAALCGPVSATARARVTPVAWPRTPFATEMAPVSSKRPAIACSVRMSSAPKVSSPPEPPVGNG
jgi:hypothetical protein